MAEQNDKDPEETREGAGAETPEQPERPGEAFKQGISMLWKAARSAADEIKREVERGGVTDALRQAGRDLETAASQAARAIEGFMDRVGPGDPKTSEWPVGNEKKDDEDPPEDGGVDEKGERRNMRIQD
jgi:hypothetical protein